MQKQSKGRERKKELLELEGGCSSCISAFPCLPPVFLHALSPRVALKEEGRRRMKRKKAGEAAAGDDDDEAVTADEEDVEGEAAAEKL